MTKFTTFLSAPSAIWTALIVLGASVVILHFVTNSRWRFAAWRAFELASASFFLSSSVTMMHPDQLGISWGILKGIFYLVLLFGARVGLQKEGDAITPFAASEWRVFIAIGFVGASVFCSLTNDVRIIASHFGGESFATVSSSDSNSELLQEPEEYAPCDNDWHDSVIVMPHGGSLCRTFKMSKEESEVFANYYGIPLKKQGDTLVVEIPEGARFLVSKDPDEGNRLIPLGYAK